MSILLVLLFVIASNLEVAHTASVNQTETCIASVAEEVLNRCGTYRDMTSRLLTWCSVTTPALWPMT